MFKQTRLAIVALFSSIQTHLTKVVATGLCLALLIGLPTMSARAASLPLALPLAGSSTIAAIGLQHQAEGAINQAAGKAEEVTGDLKGKAKGLARQVDGKAKRDIGKIESKAEEFASNGKEAATDLGEQIQDAAGSLANSVKDLVK